jgi:hypothetical protein
MKKRFATLALALAFITPAAMGAVAGGSSRTIEKMAPYDKIVVGKNLNVLLVNEEENITVEGEAAHIDLVTIECENGTLHIYNHNKTAKEKITVYVPVKKLMALQVKGSSKVVTAEPINAPDLKVLLETDCQLGLQTNGKITLQYSEDLDLNFLTIKNPARLKMQAF